MRIILAFVIFAILAACADKTAATPPKSRPNTADAIAQADSAFKELEEGKAPSLPPSSSRGGKYDATLKAANDSQKELECALSGTCPPPPAVKTEEKPAPSDTLAEKPRPGGSLAEGKAPQRGGKYPLAGGYPVWVSSPVYDGYIGGVGTAKPPSRGGYPVQRRTAVTLAQADLARSVKISVNNELTLERENADTRTQKYYSEKFSTMSRQEAGDFMSNTVVMDEWTDPKTGELYVWVVIPR